MNETQAPSVGESTDQSGPTAEAEAALAALTGLDGRPVQEHVEVFEAIHASLRAALNRSTGT